MPPSLPPTLHTQVALLPGARLGNSLRSLKALKCLHVSAVKGVTWRVVHALPGSRLQLTSLVVENCRCGWYYYYYYHHHHGMPGTIVYSQGGMLAGCFLWIAAILYGEQSKNEIEGKM